MPNEITPLTPQKVDALEHSEHWKLLIIRQLFATVRDRERERDKLQIHLNAVAGAVDELQRQLAETEAQRQESFAHFEELQRQLEKARLGGK